MSPEFETAYLSFVASSFEKQLALQKLIGGRNWNFDMNSRQLVFGKQGFFDKPIIFDVQILGSVSEADSSWLWSWANESINPNLTAAAVFLREKGVLNEFQTPDFALELGEADDHRVALTSVGTLAALYGCDSYYRGPYDGGAAFFLLRDPRLHLAPANALQIISFFPQLISNLPIANHRAAFLGYLEARQISAQINGNQVRASLGDSLLLAEFDDSNRLGELQVAKA